MERYEKLYTRIDEVFVGTPNTPSALSVKSEIIDNLTARYDELLEQGVGEDEAVERVVDTIGDLDELFGIKKVHSPAGNAVDSETVGQPSYRTLTPEEQESIWKRKKMRAFAIVLYIISIIPNILIGSLVDVMIAEALMFAIWSIATALIIGAGAYTPGADPKKRWLIASGVGMYIFAFVPMFLLMTNLTMGGIALMFVGWAIATALVILGAGRKSGTVKINYKKEAYDGLDNETRAIFKRIKCVLALIALAIYLWFSISTGGWVYSWLIWVIYGCVCDAVKALLLLNAEKKQLMKNPVRTIILNLVLVVVLIGLLIGAAQIEVLNGGSLVFGGISIGTGNDSFLVSDESYEKGSSGSASASEITSLDIAWTAGAVNIVPADSDTIRFSEESKRELEEEQLMRWRVKDGVLSIRFGTKGGPFRQDPEKTLTIEIPASDWEAENVEIQTVSANLSIDTIVTTDFYCDSVSGNCTAEEIKGNVINFNSVSGMVRIQKADCKRMSIDSVSGTITIENAAVTDQLAVSTVSGELRFSGVAKELSADTTSGDIELIFSEAGDSVEIDSTSGDATIILPEEVSGFDAEFDTMSGELSCDFSTNRKDGRFTYGDRSLEIEVDTTSGDLKIEKA